MRSFAFIVAFSLLLTGCIDPPRMAGEHIGQCDINNVHYKIYEYPDKVLLCPEMRRVECVCTSSNSSKSVYKANDVRLPSAIIEGAGKEVKLIKRGTSYLLEVNGETIPVDLAKEG